MTAALAAILLAGGRASRLGGATKPLLDVGGHSMLDAAVDAVRSAGAEPVFAVAPPISPTAPVQWVREDPPFAGPAAAVVAAFDAWPQPDAEPEWTFVLACDLPRVAEVVDTLVRDLPLLPADVDGVCLGDSSSRPQWLTGVFRTAALRKAASAVADRGVNAPMRTLLDDLAITVVATPDGLTRDVDTWEDLEQARAYAAATGLE